LCYEDSVSARLSSTLRDTSLLVSVYFMFENWNTPPPPTSQNWNYLRFFGNISKSFVTYSVTEKGVPTGIHETYFPVAKHRCVTKPK
jgi:hypothetical protein